MVRFAVTHAPLISTLSAADSAVCENFHSVRCEMKVTLISPETMTPSHAAADSQTSQAWEAYLEPSSYCLNLEESRKLLMNNIYKQVVQWKAIFFPLSRKKRDFKFTGTSKENLSANSYDCNAKTAMYCAMVMPLLILARIRTEDDAKNIQTIARRLYQWIKWDTDSVS